MVRWIPIALALILLAACSGGGADGGGRKQGGPVSVQVKPVAAEQVERLVEFTGTLGGAEEITVSAEVDGRVEKILADLGDKVDAGGTLVQIAASELRLRNEQAHADYLQALARLGVGQDGLDHFQPEKHAAVRRAEADLAEAKRNLVRGEELMKRGLLAQGELDALATRERVADAALQSALEEARSGFAQAKGRRAAWGLSRKQLGDASIRSPVQGVVARRMVSVGEYVKAGQAVAVVVVTHPLKMRGDVAERYAGEVQRAMRVDVEVDASGGTRQGEVSRVGPLVAAESRTFPVEAVFANEDGRLKAGLFARARILLGNDEQVFAVPETAVSSLAGVTKLYVLADGKAAERKVEVLRKREGDALVQGALAEGDQVIVTGIARLFDGAPVQVVETGAAE